MFLKFHNLFELKYYCAYFEFCNELCDFRTRYCKFNYRIELAFKIQAEKFSRIFVFGILYNFAYIPT